MARERGVPEVAVTEVRKWVSLGGENMLRGTFGEDIANLEQELDTLREILRGQKADPSDLFPGVIDALKTLKENGLYTAICTNKRENIAVPLASGLGIAPHLDAIVGGAVGRLLKPDPSIVELTMSRLPVKPDRAAFVGDSEVDAETAAATGLPFILVNFGYPLGEIEDIPRGAMIEHFDELCPAICKLL
ncbi:HAD family hydrolase [Rhizomicrobium palustre]